MKRTLKLASGLLLQGALALVMTLLSVCARAEEHPVKLEKDADCASCHEDKTKGKAVHSAIAMGCTTCHAVKTEGETTTVTLTSAKEQLCFTCHEKSQEKVLHGPYGQGNCTACHDSHQSDFPKQLKAEPQQLCMGCHVQSRSKVNQQSKTLTTPWGATLTFEQMKGSPLIALDRNEGSGHPMEGHPVWGRNSKGGKNAAPITCLSCHQPHHSQVRNLMPQDVPSDIELCSVCHKGD